ncbi:MAG TPA: cytochrome P450 [Polyangia bacterium]|nr:cytochrome P450 [Polyangia bacterium]
MSNVARCPFSRFVLRAPASASPTLSGKRRREPWLFGSLREFRRDLLGFLGRLAREEGDIAAFRLGRQPFLSVTAIDQVQTILGDNERFGLPYREITRRVLGDGLITSEDASWLKRRREVQPAFSSASIQKHTAIMGETAARLVAGWRDGEAIDVHDAMADLTTEVVCQTLFGVDLPAPVRSELREALATLAGHLLAKVTSAVPLPGWLPTPGNIRYRRAARRLDRVAAKILALAQESKAPSLVDLAPGPRGADGRPVLTREMRDHIVSFLLAGLEGTALTLSWTWHLLADHPEIEARLADHVREAIGDRVPTGADLPRLTYVEQVVREAMRLYPPVWGVLRQARRDTDIAGVPVARGTIVIVPQWVIHRDPRWFPNPETFDPERWAATAQRPRGSYFPFGGGQRQCVGGGFALSAAVLMLATMVPRVRLERKPGPPVRIEPFMSLRPRDGLPMVVRRRAPSEVSYGPGARVPEKLAVTLRGPIPKSMLAAQ